MKPDAGNEKVHNGIVGSLVLSNHPVSTFRSGSGPDPEAWEWTKLRKIIHRQIDKFISLVPATLQDGNIEAVTKMRITSRRLEQILDLLYPKPRPRRIKKLRRQLKACRRALGELRNYDALVKMAEQSLAITGTPEGEAWKAVKEYLEELRLNHAPEALLKFGRINLTSSYVRLKRDLESEDLLHLAARNGDRKKVKIDGGKDLFSERITQSLDRRWRDFETAVERSRSDPREKVIHRMRIAAKRLRYLTEAMQKLHINGSTEIVSWLQSFQRIVGRWHDRELLEHAMADMLAQEKFCNENPTLIHEVQKLMVRNRALKEALEQKFSWMTSRSRHFQEAREWVLQLLTNGNGNGGSTHGTH